MEIKIHRNVPVWSPNDTVGRQHTLHSPFSTSKPFVLPTSDSETVAPTTFAVPPPPPSSTTISSESLVHPSCFRVVLSAVLWFAPRLDSAYDFTNTYFTATQQQLCIRATKERRNERRNEGTKERRNEGTKERRNEGTNKGTKERIKERRNE